MTMNKKIVWGLIALVIVVALALTVFLIGGEDENSEEAYEEEQELEDMEDTDLLWVVEDNLFSAYELIFTLEDQLDNDDVEEYMNRYDQLEEKLFLFQDDYYGGFIDEDEFEEGLNDISEEIDSFIEELENL